MLTAITVLAAREDGRLRARLEVAVLVEDAVVRQVLLVVGARLRAVVEHGRGVEDVVALAQKKGYLVQLVFVIYLKTSGAGCSSI